ncbi:MAG: hypothetical protein L0Y38_02075 [Methylococcaceae bacterium]|nr:hypothetical protein [Methylococcaceae bacterium]MCI0667276.1 hypothetical protein [Methylococcaceae bacterium]MCI0732592.1 hypothetical protein [Methylococcaceae bacterium]
MNSLILAVYDEKSLRRKIRDLKSCPDQDLEPGPDSPFLPETFGGLAVHEGKGLLHRAESPAVME